MRWVIRREKIFRDSFRASHYEAVHPGWAGWSERFFRKFFSQLAAFSILLVIADFLWLSYGGVYAVIDAVVVVLFIAFCLFEIDYVLRRARRNYRRQWKDKNDPSDSK